MGKTTSTIELNGQRYNAHTGVAIDGFKLVQPSITKNPSLKRAVAPSKQIHKTTQQSHTLMRHAVKKPSTITDRKTIAMDVVPHTPGETASQVFHAPNADRFKRAAHVPKLSVVSRFGTVGSSPEAARAPQVSDMLRPNPALSTPKTPPTPSLVTHTNSHKTNKMLDKGLRAADSHNKPATKKEKLRHRVGRKFGLSKRATSITAGAMAVFALGGFFTYQNMPNINVRYAAAKAGVRASLPSYQPAGFAVNNHVEYEPGELTIAYKANADDRKYTVTQKNTTWNSDALKDHLTTSNETVPQTYPDNGRTIYLHEDSSADWVNNGVWYSISGDSSLNTDQLIKIATSI